MKSDLAEFKTTMTTDTTTFISQTSANLLEKTTSGALFGFGESSATDQEKIIQQPKEKAKSKLSGTKSGKSVTSLQSRFEEELKLMQSSESTFLIEPKIESEFTEWQTNFNPDSFKSEISDLLIENSSLRILYSQMVMFVFLFIFEFLQNLRTVLYRFRLKWLTLIFGADTFLR